MQSCPLLGSPLTVIPPSTTFTSLQELEMADKIKEVAVEEAERIKTLASDAARSGAYLYPLRVSVIPMGSLPLFGFSRGNSFECVSDEPHY
jgi:hypothetical protein